MTPDLRPLIEPFDLPFRQEQAALCKRYESGEFDAKELFARLEKLQRETIAKLTEITNEALSSPRP